MNIHHLELFYYVARAGGISAAARSIPYGIQQPAISQQMALLEEDLGRTLFQRRPFALTSAGQALYDFSKPFFDNLDDIAAGIREGSNLHRIRIAASRVVLRDYLPGPLRRVREQFSPFAFSLVSESAEQMLQSLDRDETDLVISVLTRKLPAGCTSEMLTKVPFALAVREDAPWKTAGAVLKDAKKLTLLDLPSEEPMSRMFHQECRGRGVRWRSRMEMDNFDLLLAYVAEGFGVAVTAIHAGLPPGVRMLRLTNFPRIELHAIWRQNPSDATRALIDEVRRTASTV